MQVFMITSSIFFSLQYRGHAVVLIGIESKAGGEVGLGIEVDEKDFASCGI